MVPALSPEPMPALQGRPTSLPTSSSPVLQCRWRGILWPAPHGALSPQPAPAQPGWDQAGEPGCLRSPSSHEIKVPQHPSPSLCVHLSPRAGALGPVGQPVTTDSPRALPTAGSQVTTREAGRAGGAGAAPTLLCAPALHCRLWSSDLDCVPRTDAARPGPGSP